MVKIAASVVAVPFGRGGIVIVGGGDGCSSFETKLVLKLSIAKLFHASQKSN